ncbi:polyketide synthase [Bordetella ansorpii]|uniref:Phenolphthiocerol/phthiocerol polyketide synthase subunit E n=1 Tax=Bordetella ansorpii TaxID=288768 RepID=A0A157MGX3_9BORD|nr:type I polyketide synthase [Bordetella ansorpii]SAI08030.1 polyketide synthase [Bordetella ansorpii]
MNDRDPAFEDDDDGLAIAIVGMAGRFPGAADVDALWRNVAAGVEAIQRYTDAQLTEHGVPLARRDDPAFVAAGAVLPDLDGFDAAFFGYSARQAQLLDPQQRFFLETAVHALEDAGYYGRSQPARVGVYAGSGVNQYAWRNLLPAGMTQGDDATLAAILNGNDKDALCTRVAYELDLRGPAVSVQTACSTSLVAVHLACQSLLNYEADLALAGGVSLNLGQWEGYYHQVGSIRSPDGYCRAFDARAAGTVSGSGAAAVVLKRLSDARDDGDNVLAVIKGSAINNDGSGKAGYTAPSTEGQARVILAAQAAAGVAADSIGYVEAHGTGTALGDPIEIAALTRAFGQSPGRAGQCGIGSIKTQIGHLDAAAGVTGLIKAVQALRHATLPPTLNFQTPNPEIDFAAGPFRVLTQAETWPVGPLPRRAGVSSFGIGGTNAHVVLEEAPARPAARAPRRRWQVLPVSARSAAALDGAQARLGDRLAQGDVAAADAAWTLQQGRREFDWRGYTLMATDGQTLAPYRPAAARHEAPQVAMLFPGQGSQHAGMAVALYQEEPAFRATVDECCAILQPLLGLDLRRPMFATGPAAREAAAELARTALTQPALFVIEYALARLWMSWGVQPTLMLGHSVGEYVAACLSGVFPLPDALSLIAARGRLMQQLPAGAMLAVPLSPDQAARWTGADCGIAAVNAGNLCVLSGTPQAIETAEQGLAAQGIEARRLTVSHAFHSPMVEPVLDTFAALVEGVPRQPPSIPWISNLSGQPITTQDAVDPRYWARHLRGTVQFALGLDTLLAEPGRVLLETGPGAVLTALARRHPRAADAAAVLASLPTPRDAADAAQCCAQTVGRLWCAGVPLDWSAYQGTDGRRVSLPGYPFERRSYWIEGAETGTQAPRANDTPGDSRPVEAWFEQPCWTQAAPLADGAAPAPGHWLLFGQHDALTAALRARLERLGADIVFIERAARYEVQSASHYALRPGAAEDMARLLDALGDRDTPLAGVVHAWSVPAAGRATDQAILEEGFYSVVAMIQAVLGAGPGRRVKDLPVTIVCSQAMDVSGADRLLPARATLTGPCRVLPHEAPDIRCRLVDVPADPAARYAGWLAGQVLASQWEGGTVQAYRGPQRWTLDYAACAPLADPQAPGLRHEGVYLITGGLGGMGLALATHLATQSQARCVLLGRSAVAPQPQWAALASDADTPGERARYAALQALHATGVPFEIVQGDVTDPQSIPAALERARARFGALHGVIHAAGLPGGGVLAQRGHEAMAAVLAPKVDGTRALLRAVEGLELDFIVLCSSIAAAVGAYGDADYCAANAYLDACAARARQALGVPVWSLGWDTWSEVGMAAHRQAPSGAAIAPGQGAAALARIVATAGGGNVLVSPQGLRAKRARAQSLDYADDVAQPVVAATRHPRPALPNAYVAPASDLEEALAELWSGVLGFEPIGAGDSLFDLGGDSLTAIQILAQVRKQYELALHPAELFNDPTVAGLATRVELGLIEQIARS